MQEKKNLNKKFGIMAKRFKNFGIFYNPQHFASLLPIKEKIEVLLKYNFAVYILQEQSDEIFEGVEYISGFTNKKVDLVIAFGGDGTMLKVLKLVLKENIPVLGINHGKVGFLSECEKEEFSEVIEHLLHNEFSIEHRSVIACRFKNKTYYAINDIEVDRGKYPHIIALDVFLEKNLLYRINGDGVIVSTPTGSTAYSLSAGGSVLHPHCNSFIITPNNPHNQFSKPIVVSDDTNIKIKFINGKHCSLFNIDGMNISEIYPGDELLLKKSDYYSKFIKVLGNNFCQIFRNKFNFDEV